MSASTYLFVPGDRPERFEKAHAVGADVVVIDLEDAVALESKNAARAHIANALRTGERHACIRINGSDTHWFDEDLALLALPGVSAVMLPKAESTDALEAVRTKCAAQVKLIPIVETAQGLARVEALCKAPGVARLAFGSIDFQLDLGIEADDNELLFARSQLVLASRVARIAAPIDGVTMAVKDTEQTRADALRARRLGFGAKLCIHPSQVATVKDVFTPDAESIAWARGVVQAAAATTSGALTYMGKLIDKPVIDKARRLLAQVEP